MAAAPAILEPLGLAALHGFAVADLLQLLHRGRLLVFLKQPLPSGRINRDGSLPLRAAVGCGLHGPVKKRAGPGGSGAGLSVSAPWPPRQPVAAAYG